jgi:hypothetical protein
VPYKKPKIEKVFFSIGEVAEWLVLHLPPSAIGKAVLKSFHPKKSSKGTRLFSHDDIETVKFINHLVKERGMTIKGVQQKLKGNRQDAIDNWEIVKRLQKVKEELVAIRNEME